MMYDFLDQRSDANSSKVTNKLLDDLSLATRKSEELIKVLLKVTSKETADEVILSVSNKVEAENFIKSVLMKFGINSLDDEGIRTIDNKVLPSAWYEFLESIGPFYIDEIFHEEELRSVMWGPSSKGVQIGHYKNDEFVLDPENELEKSYEAFKLIDNVTRKELIN